ncbi:hypothetical protein MHYP_G00196140 [Metynnis hypsauchen]
MTGNHAVLVFSIIRMAVRLLVLLSSLLFAFELASSAYNSDIKDTYSISLVVYNSLKKDKNLTYTVDIAYRGILLGAMKKLQDTSTFRFTTTEDPNYGPFLVSVNGVPGIPADHTYWELLAQLKNGTTIRPDVGVGCYIPNPDDMIILKFRKWDQEKDQGGVSFVSDEL